MKRLAIVTGGAFIGIMGLSPTPAQALTPTFSIDFQGPTVHRTDGFWSGARISEGDILTPALPGPPGPNPPALGTLPPPGIARSIRAIRHGIRGYRELDALSYGHDPIRETLINGHGSIFFSVDEFATGISGSPTAPNVFTEGAVGAHEASADVYRSPSPGSPTGPVTPPGSGNTLAIDGNALPSPTPAIPGVGLIEPNRPSASLMDQGDNLDALDVDTSHDDLSGPIYFS